MTGRASDKKRVVKDAKKVASAKAHKAKQGLI